MSIEQFIDNEVKSNDVVLFMKGTPQMPMCGFSGQVVPFDGHAVDTGLDSLGALDLPSTGNYNFLATLHPGGN